MIKVLSIQKRNEGRAYFSNLTKNENKKAGR